jgi:hypothetical protein
MADLLGGVKQEKMQKAEILFAWKLSVLIACVIGCHFWPTSNKAHRYKMPAPKAG